MMQKAPKSTTIKHKSQIPKPTGMPKKPLNLLMTVIKQLGIDLKTQMKNEHPTWTEDQIKKGTKSLKYRIYHERNGDVWNWHLATPSPERVEINIGKKTHGQWINDKTKIRDPKFVEIKNKIDQESAICKKKMEEYKLTEEYKVYNAKKKVERDSWKVKTPQLNTQAPPQQYNVQQYTQAPQQQYTQVPPQQYNPPMQTQTAPVTGQLPTYTPPQQGMPQGTQPGTNQWATF